MRFGTVCSGIGAPELAWTRLGWQSVFASEIDAFPSAVLAHHYPETPNLGDMTGFKEWPDAGIDVLAGGTPCQSFSVAGLREGLADPRGQLALVFLAIAHRYRPRWVIWENVPGVLSRNGGRDFGSIVGALAELGYGWAYRVLDAQFTRTHEFSRAVPQQRRRVFLVGYLGDWRPPAAVFLDAESLRWAAPPRRRPGEKAATTLVGGAPRGGSAHGAQSGTAKETNLILDYVPDVHPALAARDAKGARPQDGANIVATFFEPYAGGLTGNNVREEVAGALHAGGKSAPSVLAGPFPRRLTPTEWERLMGLPDGYTGISYRGRPAKDGPRYKAIGNSMPVNVMSLIGQRIDMVESFIRERDAA